MMTSSPDRRSRESRSNTVAKAACVMLLALTACTAAERRDVRQPSDLLGVMRSLAVSGSFSDSRVAGNRLGVELTDLGQGVWWLQADSRSRHWFRTLSVRREQSDPKVPINLSINLNADNFYRRVGDIIRVFDAMYKVPYLPLPPHFPSTGSNISGMEYGMGHGIVFRATFYRQVCAQALKIYKAA